MSDSQSRAEMPIGTHQILDRRSIHNANKNLLELLKPGMTVLDVGCGSGSITKGIADLVGVNGRVVGLDPSENLIGQAKTKYADYENLAFIQGDLFDFVSKEKFDLVTSARVIQWLDNPTAALKRLTDFLKPGGFISILDYNHSKIIFKPTIPQSMAYFYDRFLHWRSDAGFDNEIGDHLTNIFKSIGVKNIRTQLHHEVSEEGSEHFMAEISLWKKVAETRGKQLVKDKYITEDERLQAIADYQSWMDNDALKMELYLKSVTGET